MRNDSFRIAVLPGDGIGVEVMAPCLEVLNAATERTGGFQLVYEEGAAGAFTYRDTGVALPKKTIELCDKADAILLGACGWPEIRYPDGREIMPQVDLRTEFDLYAGVRPVRVSPGMPKVFADPRAESIDFVLIRESTEGLFAKRDEGEIIDDKEGRETLVITRAVSERLFDFGFKLARQRKARGGKGLVSCIDKANVFRTFAFFRKIFEERAALNPDIQATSAYVDATALDFVRRPWTFDVMVTENMFGDILSDLGAGLMGGLGFAPSADIGDSHAVFQPCHGTAPDIAGQKIANPTAMILSGAMMLEWLGDKHGREEATRAAGLIRRAVDEAFTTGLEPCDRGGSDGTATIANAVLEALRKAPAEVA